ncbi:hypothetical protein GGTG_03981 [Gaeumannomyces tritici R3-111a-1]|uniref:Uncharacterized protein n=1 Tax=Gaeumannomyces tritici (strain R3-111a-1) TaxID=644352 RepID=J3NRT1_GAET3|nr:hypothetical protein GGTG_03981 [Gaeumannomyces tritici R3-111a-1]EJT78887.1 hypothetical protein GGTG_03981 [Gaeumannomyces tritici R3-111a-1]
MCRFKGIIGKQARPDQKKNGTLFNWWWCPWTGELVRYAWKEESLDSSHIQPRIRKENSCRRSSVGWLLYGSYGSFVCNCAQRPEHQTARQQDTSAWSSGSLPG